MGVKAGLDPHHARRDQRRQRPQHRGPEHKFPKIVMPRTFDSAQPTGLIEEGREARASEADRRLGPLSFSLFFPWGAGGFSFFFFSCAVPMDVTQAVAAAMQIAARDRAEQDRTTLVQPLERRAGVEVKVEE